MREKKTTQSNTIGAQSSRNREEGETFGSPLNKNDVNRPNTFDATEYEKPRSDGFSESRASECVCIWEAEQHIRSTVQTNTQADRAIANEALWDGCWKERKIPSHAHTRQHSSRDTAPIHTDRARRHSPAQRSNANTDRERQRQNDEAKQQQCWVRRSTRM